MAEMWDILKGLEFSISKGFSKVQVGIDYMSLLCLVNGGCAC